MRRFFNVNELSNAAMEDTLRRGYGLRLNTKKTEYLEASPQTDSTISVDGEDLAKVSHFKYLGLMFSNNDDILPDV